MVKKYFHSYNSFNYATLNYFIKEENKEIRKKRYSYRCKRISEGFMFRIRIIFLPAPTFVFYIFKRELWRSSRDIAWTIQDTFSFLTRLFHIFLNKLISFVAKRIDMMLSLVYEVYWILNIYQITIICSFTQILALWKTVWYQLMINHYI